MQIRGMTLPSQFIDCVQSGVLRRARGSWLLIHGHDSYGNPLETELGDIYETTQQIEQESALLPQHFPSDLADLPDEFTSAPGFIPYITDFTRLLTFAIAGDGAPYCFDFRESNDPSVIWWDDAYWRRVAPTFPAFLSLFDIERKAK